MRLIGSFSLALCLALPTAAATAQGSGESAIIEQIEATVPQIRSGKTIEARTQAAEHLASLTQKVSGNDVTEKLVNDLTSLLDSPDDSVRYWVAWGLGNLGPAAKAAVPKLEEMLPKADCLNGVITSASGIRYALGRMGVKEPSRPKCVPDAG